jgi:hypothetical protein
VAVHLAKFSLIMLQLKQVRSMVLARQEANILISKAALSVQYSSPIIRLEDFIHIILSRSRSSI